MILKHFNLFLFLKDFVPFLSLDILAFKMFPNRKIRAFSKNPKKSWGILRNVIIIVSFHLLRSFVFVFLLFCWIKVSIRKILFLQRLFSEHPGDKIVFFKRIIHQPISEFGLKYIYSMFLCAFNHSSTRIAVFWSKR